MLESNIEKLERKLIGLIPNLPFPEFRIPNNPIITNSPKELYKLIGKAPNTPIDINNDEKSKTYLLIPDNPIL